MRIKDLDTDKIYASVKEVQRALQITDRSNLYAHLRGRTKSIQKHHLAYIDVEGQPVKDRARLSRDAKTSILFYMTKINTAFNFQQWGHWASLIGLRKLFDVEDGEVNTFCKVLRLNFKSMTSSRAGSFNYCGSKNGLFFYTPLFKEQYWAKIVQIKKQVPVIIDILKRGPEKNVDHGYEMLLGVKLIPTAEEYREYRDQPVAENVFDFDAVTPYTLKEYNKLKFREK